MRRNALSGLRKLQRCLMRSPGKRKRTRECRMRRNALSGLQKLKRYMMCRPGKRTRESLKTI